MRTIWKYDLPNALDSGKDKISLPCGAKPLHVEMQNDAPRIWIEVSDPDQPCTDDWLFFTVGTGHELPENAIYHVGTLLLNRLVCHVYTNREAV